MHGGAKKKKEPRFISLKSQAGNQTESSRGRFRPYQGPEK